MVAVSAPAGMPTRQYSMMIIGGIWPQTDPSSCQTVSEAQHDKAVDLLDCADSVRSRAADVASEQSGHAIDGFCGQCHRDASTYTAQADRYFAMARVSEEVGRLLYGLREDLDQIDAEAHSAIEQVEKALQAGLLAAMVAGQEIMAIVAAARAMATAKAGEVTAAIAAQGAKIGIAGAPTGGGQSAGSATNSGFEIPKQGGFGGGSIRDGFPTGLPGNIPEDVPLKTDEPHAGANNPDAGVVDDGNGQAGKDGNEPKPVLGKPQPVADGQGTPHAASHNPDSAGGEAPPFGATGLPLMGGSSGPSSLSPPSPTTGLGNGGFKMPSTPGGLGGGGGLPTQGMTSPGGLGSGGMPSGGSPMPSPSAPPSDFTRGLNAGLGGGGGGPAAFAPPVPPPASTASGSAAPAGAVASGPAPVAAAAGGPAVPTQSAPVAAPLAGGIPTAGGGPSAPMGPLPPFGSEVPRTPPPPAAVSPAAGPPTPAPTAGGGGSGAGTVAPLPPGVVGSGVGASAGVTSEAIRSSLPDPLLASASQLVYQLLHDSRMYPYMDWCVGVFRTSSGIETLIVNSEGAGYIPAGVFVPRSARMLFSDGGLSQEFRARWFSWANPAETMLAYAALTAEHHKDVELWALAVSTDDGGSSVPARAVIQHVEDCSRSLSPSSDGGPASQLDEVHVHRLETLDRALYARLTGFGEGPLPDRSEAWRTTVAAAQMALGRAGSIPDFAVPPAIREVLDLLGQGQPVPMNRWQELEAAHIGAVMSGAGLRPGRMTTDTGAGAHVLAHHDLARLIELLLLWRLDTFAYPEIAYLAGQIHLTPRLAGVP